MNNLFRNILVPIDLSVNTEIAVKKAIELAETDTTIHLLYVKIEDKPASIFSFSRFVHSTEKMIYNIETEHKINQWKNSISENSDQVKVHSWIVAGDSVQQTIIDSARNLSIDLIIIGKNANHSWLPFLNTVVPSTLATKTGIVVLTVKPGGIYKKAKTMVVPVTNENAINKIAVIYAICKKFPVNIRLVTFTNYENNIPENDATTLLQLYQTLRLSLQCQIECIVLKSNYRAKGILEYADKVNADMILVDPNTETKIGWPNKYISDMLPATSKIQVWAV